jgi:hypothetical protein
VELFLRFVLVVGGRTRVVVGLLWEVYRVYGKAEWEKDNYDERRSVLGREDVGTE